MPDETAWTRLAAHVRWRLNELGWAQKDLAERAGVTARTVSTLLSGRPRGREPISLAAIEQALGWAPGRAREILDNPEFDAARARHGTTTAPSDDEPVVDVREAMTILELLRSAVSRLPVDARARAILTASADDLEWKIERAVAAERDNTA